MSTITPTSDSTTIIDYTAFAIGDQVVSLDTSLHGVVREINFGGMPSQVFVQWSYNNSGAVSVLRLRHA